MKHASRFLPFLTLILLASCEFSKERVRGNGNIKTESRNIRTFHSIDAGGAIDVYVKQDSITSVRVEADENLLPYIKTESSGESLRIYTDRDYNLSGTLKVYVSNPSFSHLDVSGASNLYGETKVSNSGKIGLHASGASSIKLEVDAPAIDAEISGASDMSLRGTTKTLVVNSSGASGLKAFDLMSETADVDVSGAGHAEVFASIKLNATASGASRIKYRGNASTNINQSGAGNVSKAD